MGLQDRTKTMGVPGNRGVPFLLSRRAHLLTTCKQAMVSLPLVGLVRSSRTVFPTVLQRGQEMPQAGIPCAVGSIFCTISKTMRWHIATPSRRLPA